MNDLSKSEKIGLATRSQEVISLIEELRVKHGPITSAEQLQKLLSPEEYQLAVIEKVKQVPLGEILETEAQVKGFKSVLDMLDWQDKEDRTHKRDAGLDVNLLTGEISRHSDLDKADEALQCGFSKFVEQRA